MVWYLAKNQDVQETLYQEITDAVESNNGEERLNYETIIQNMPFLEGIHNQKVIEKRSSTGRFCKNSLIRPFHIIQ